jgi:serine/threonine protein kinase
VGVAPTPKMALEAVVRVAREDVRFVRKIGDGAFGEVSQATVFPYGTVAIKWLKASAPVNLACAQRGHVQCGPAGLHGGCVLRVAALAHGLARQPHEFCADGDVQKDRFAKYSESFMREAEVLATLNHPNIIRMYGLVTERDAAGGGGDGVSSSDAGGRSAPGAAGPSAPAHAQSSGPPAGDGLIIAGIMTEFVRGGPLSHQLRCGGQHTAFLDHAHVGAAT